MNLSGDVWPIHFPPFPGESFTSWFSRLAIYQFQVPSTFMLRTIPHRADAWKQDLDVKCPSDVLSIVEKRCCQPLIRRHLLQHWLPNFSPYDGTSTALPRWVAPAYIRRKSAHHYGVRYCPACMRERPYHRLFFRLLFISTCPRHGLPLLDRCHACQSPVSTRKIYEPLLKDCPSDALCYCFSCGFDYRFSPRTCATDSERNSVKFSYSAVTKGYCHIGGLQLQYSHLYFQGLRLIASALLRPRLSPYLEELNFPNLPGLGIVLREQEELEFLPVDQIRPLIALSHTLIEDWPDRFLAVNRRYGLRYSDWILPRSPHPYWFSSVAKRHIRKANLTSRGG